MPGLAQRPFESRRRDVDGEPVEVAAEQVVTRWQSAWSTPCGWSTKTVKRSGPVSSTAITSMPGVPRSTVCAISRKSVLSFS